MIFAIMVPLAVTLYLSYILLTDSESFFNSVGSQLRQISWINGLLIIQLLIYFLFGWGTDSYVEAIFIVITYFASLIIPHFSYPILSQTFNKGFLTLVALANVWLNLLATIALFNRLLEIVQLNDLIMPIVIILSLNAFAHVLLHLLKYFVQFVSNGQPNRQSSHKNVKADMRDHYYQAGLDDGEIEYFREQMATAQQQILTLEKNMQATVKLKAIDQEHNTLATAKHYFKDIVQEPKRIASAGDFLYKLLPTMVDLTSKYNEINQHVAKNKQTYLILNRSAEVINNLAQEITEDYLAFHEATFQAFDDDIKYAEHIMGQDKDWDSIFNQSNPDDEIFNQQEETDHDQQ